MKRHQLTIFVHTFLFLVGFLSVAYANELEGKLTSSGDLKFIAQAVPIGVNGQPMRATIYGWETSLPAPSAPVRWVTPPRIPYPPRSYWNNYYLYGYNSVYGGGYPCVIGDLPGISEKRPDPTPSVEDRRPHTIEESAINTVYAFMGAIKYNDPYRARNYLPASARINGLESPEMSYINKRLGKVQDVRILSTKKIKDDTVKVKTQYLFNDGSGNLVPENKTFIICNGIIINPL